MNVNMVLSFANVFLAVVNTLGVFRLVGNWRDTAEKEERELKTRGFGKAGGSLRVSLAFAKAGLKVDDWCGVMGSAAAVLLTVAVLFAVAVLIVDNVASAAPGQVAVVSASQPAGQPNPVSPGSPAGAGQTGGGQQMQAVAPGTNSSALPQGRSALYLCGVNSVMFVLLFAILAGVWQLKIIGSVLQAGRDASW